MLELKQIESFYPEPLRAFKKNLLREYLQYKILESIYESRWGNKLVFTGETAIHLIHENPRFSEDLDFDNRGLKREDFEELTLIIKRSLMLEGYPVEIRNVYKGAYRSYIKIGEILFHNRISPLKDQKLLIEVDTEPQNFSYEPDRVILNKFDVFTQINTTPLDILLSQKLSAIFSRKRAMGRDFFDAVFLLSKTGPNFSYLEEKLKIDNLTLLLKKLKQHCKNLDFNKLAKDVEPFLHRPGDAKKVLHFEDYIAGLKS